MSLSLIDYSKSSLNRLKESGDLFKPRKLKIIPFQRLAMFILIKCKEGGKGALRQLKELASEKR